MTVGNEVRLGKLCWNDLKKIKIHRDHLAAFRIILLLLDTLTLSVCTKEFLYRNSENGNTWSTMFTDRIYHFNAYIPKKSTQCVKVGERTSGWKRYILERKQLDDLLHQFHNWFLDQSSSHIIVECCFSNSIWWPSKAVTCWPVGDGGGKRDSEGRDICEHGIHIWQFVVLVAHQTTSIIRMLQTLVYSLLNCVMHSNQKLSQQLRTDKLQHTKLHKVIMVWIHIESIKTTSMGNVST